MMSQLRADSVQRQEGGSWALEGSWPRGAARTQWWGSEAVRTSPDLGVGSNVPK